MLRSIESTTTVLSRLDPDPVEIVNADGKSAFLLTCEHAGRAVPVSLGDLGIDAAEMDRHIAYDVGAEGLSRQMASMLDAPLIVQRYSRLVVDCNRPSAAPDCFPEVSDGTIIPGQCRAFRARATATLGRNSPAVSRDGRPIARPACRSEAADDPGGGAQLYISPCRRAVIAHGNSGFFRTATVVSPNAS